MPNVVITGTGVVSAAGCGASRIVNAMATGTNLFDSNVGQGDDAGHLSIPIAKVSSDDTPWPDDEWWVDNKKFASLSARWAVAAVLAALRTVDTPDEESERGGVVVAISTGDEEVPKTMPRLAALSQSDPRPLATILYEEVPDFSYLRSIPSQVGQFVAKASGFLGSNLAVYGEAGAGGFSAASLALRLLESGELDRVFVVGVDPPLSPATLALLDCANPIATEAAPGRGPFDAERRGILLGQGAAAILFENKDAALRRRVTPLAEFSCCETICADSLLQAIGSAVELVLTQVDQPPDLWWARGTGSVALDAVQCQAVAPLVKATTTSTGGTIGSVFECAGLIDIAVAVEALNREIMPPVGLLRNPDPALNEIEFVFSSSQPAPGQRSALITAFGHPNKEMTGAGAAIVTRV